MNNICRTCAGYLPVVTTPCQSASAPASRRIGVCSGNDILMITELGKRAVIPTQTTHDARTRCYLGRGSYILPRFTPLFVLS